MVDQAHPTRSPQGLFAWRAAVAAAVLYFVAGGVLTLWFPSDGLDLYCSYVAGVCTTHGESPYERSAYVRTWDALPTPAGLTDSRAFAFAYPPSWLPVCVALGRLSWPAARTLWKLANVGFLTVTVLLVLRLLRSAGLDGRDRAAIWCFALVLSPTLTVLAVGQSSLLVVAALVAAGVSLHEARPFLAGLALAVAMTKPQLAAAFVVLLVLRRELVTLAVGATASLALTALGLGLARSGVGTYLAALGTYAETNGPTSHIAVGVASLLAHATAASTPTATVAGAAVGILLLAAFAWHHRADGARIVWPDALPLALYVSPLAFRCHAYDLVALIPLFAWSRAPARARPLRIAIQALCLVLVIPRGAYRLAWDLALGRDAAPAAYHVVERGVRTWVLLALLPAIVLALRRREAPPAPVAP